MRTPTAPPVSAAGSPAASALPRSPWRAHDGTAIRADGPPPEVDAELLR
ncbi:hypothetical protein ACIQOF_22765 [Streptomyces sp. NPDC091265]